MSVRGSDRWMPGIAFVRLFLRLWSNSVARGQFIRRIAIAQITLFLFLFSNIFVLGVITAYEMLGKLPLGGFSRHYFGGRCRPVHLPLRFCRVSSVSALHAATGRRTMFGRGICSSSQIRPICCVLIVSSVPSSASFRHVSRHCGGSTFVKILVPTVLYPVNGVGGSCIIAMSYAVN